MNDSNLFRAKGDLISDQLNQAQLTAPEVIWLQHNDSGYMGEPFPSDHSGTSWCDEEVFTCDVRYVRADIADAKLAELEARIAELEAQAAIGQRAVEMLRALEWSRPVLNRYGFWAQGCIECGRGRESGHTEKCATAAILRDAWQAESSNSRAILGSSDHVRDATKMVTGRQLADAVNELRAITIAADALVDRWHTPLWKDAKPTAEYIAALRLAAESARKLLEGCE